MSFALQGNKDSLDREESVSGTEEPKDQHRTAQKPQHSSSPDQTAGPSDYSVLQEHTTPAAATPESGGPSESEERTKKLLAAYQRTLDVAEDLPAVVWLQWGEKGLRRFLKVPYLRWFLRYFLTHHINKSLSALNRRLHANAALSNDPDINTAERDTVKLYLQSLPPPPYRRLVFAVVFAALLVALPLQGFGNVLDVLPLVGAVLRLDVTYVSRAFTGADFGDTVRATIVLLLALSVVASLLTSPFGLKRLLFNLHPLTNERIARTAARDHAFSVKGLYILEEQVFS